MPNPKFKETYGSPTPHKHQSPREPKQSKIYSNGDFQRPKKVTKEIKLPELIFKWVKWVLLASALIAIILAGGLVMITVLVLFIVASVVRRIFFGRPNPSGQIIRRRF